MSWRPVTVSVAPAEEPLSIEAARAHCHIEPDETHHDTDLTSALKAARARVESHCGIRLVTQTVVMKAACFEDLAHFPTAPIQSIASIEYVDLDGVTQTLAESVYETRLEGYAPGVVLAYAQVWPSRRPGSLVTVTAVAGFGLQAAQNDEILHAIRLLTGHYFENREAVNVGNIVTALPHAVDDLLVNHRLYSA